MRRLIALVLLAPLAARAHPGDHAGLGPDHALSAPDHLAALALLAGAVGLVLWALARR